MIPKPEIQFRQSLRPQRRPPSAFTAEASALDARWPANPGAEKEPPISPGRIPAKAHDPAMHKNRYPTARPYALGPGPQTSLLRVWAGASQFLCKGS
jgi:hypothetical protein